MVWVLANNHTIDDDGVTHKFNQVAPYTHRKRINTHT